MRVDPAAAALVIRNRPSTGEMSEDIPVMTRQGFPAVRPRHDTRFGGARGWQIHAT